MALTFANTDLLWFLLIIPLLILAHFFSLRYVQQKALVFANFPAIEKAIGTRILSKNIFLLIIRTIIIALIIFSAAGATYWYIGVASNLNYAIVIDSSSSMLADDYQPNRLEAAKQAALDFVDSLQGKPKVAVVSFSGTSLVELRPTEDLRKVKDAIREISIKDIGGTDIGGSIITGTTLLAGEDKSSVIILITDGRSNVGEIIEEAIAYANINQITINTIGIGTVEGGQVEGTSFTSTLDEETLKIIASSTNGDYYKARDLNELQYAYNQIINLSEANIPLRLSLPLLILALIMLVVEWVLINTKYRILP